LEKDFMGFRKFQADAIFTGTELLGADQVLIMDQHGVVEAIVPAAEAGEEIQYQTGWLSPGFVNAHCHLELSHMKGLIPEGTGLVDFILSILQLRHFPEDEILQAISDAEASMIQNSIVAVGDISNNSTSFLQKSKNNLAWHTFLEISGFSPQIASMRFEQGLAAYRQFEPLQGDAFRLSMAAHAPYSVSNALWELMAPYYHGKTTSLHNQETDFEDDFLGYQKGDFTRLYDLLKVDTSFYHPTGKSSLQSVAHHFAGAKQVLLVHDTFTKEADLDFIAALSEAQQTQYHFCLCVNANLYINKALPPIELLRQKNCGMVLGTDSLASNHQLSILSEIKTIQKHYPQIPLTEILQWATLNGAKALGFDMRLGSFEKGKQPGMVWIKEASMFDNK
jgi:aminodeoxyfutalosine deaminase